MAKRLSDAELAQRTRAGNRRRSEHHRQRLESAGHVQLVVWTPVEIKTALESLATNRNQTLSATATALLSAALTTTTPNQTTTTNRNASNDSTVDLFPRLESESAPTLTKDERIQRIIELKRTGLSNYAIGDQLGCSERPARMLRATGPDSHRATMKEKRK